MQDQAAAEQTWRAEGTTETFDLVVVGAGVAGLNALYAATDYLPKGARVLLIDQKQGPGGMWNTAYDFVRLHQPHPMFTVGDVKWDWAKPRDYLAKRDEVQTHLASALGPVSNAVELEAAFQQTVVEAEEVQTDCGYQAKVVFRPNGADSPTRTVLAPLAIHAQGLNYTEAAPLPLASSNVVSIIPQNLRQTLNAHPSARLVVVGGGKTGMDTILAALDQDPNRKISLINGSGTNFLNRTKYIPTGLKRWTKGELASRLFRDLALNFDGDNEDHTLSHLRTAHSTDPAGQNGTFLYGLQSEKERAEIDAGLSATLQDYLEDVTDGSNGPAMMLRNGTKTPVEAGTIFVNCTGSFFRGAQMADAIPLLSPNRTLIGVNARDGFHFLTSVAAFFMTHLFYRGELLGKGFYRLDQEALFRQNRNAWVGASAAQAYLNQVIAVQALPVTLLDRCGLDLDRWYPFPRRVAGLLKMKASAKQDKAHCCATLNRVADRFGIRCEPIE